MFKGLDVYAWWQVGSHTWPKLTRWPSNLQTSNYLSCKNQVAWITFEKVFVWLLLDRAICCYQDYETKVLPALPAVHSVLWPSLQPCTSLQYLATRLHTYSNIELVKLWKCLSHQKLMWTHDWRSLTVGATLTRFKFFIKTGCLLLTSQYLKIEAWSLPSISLILPTWTSSISRFKTYKWPWITSKSVPGNQIDKHFKYLITKSQFKP